MSIELRPPQTEEELADLAEMQKDARAEGGIDPYADTEAVCLFVTTPEVVGFVAYHTYRPVFQRCRVALWIAPAQRGKGYGKAAHLELNRMLFEDMNIHRIEGAVIDTNAAMKRLCESIGMTEEGMLRQAAFHDGGFHNYVQYAILRTDRS